MEGPPPTGASNDHVLVTITLSRIGSALCSVLKGCSARSLQPNVFTEVCMTATQRIQLTIIDHCRQDLRQQSLGSITNFSSVSRNVSNMSMGVRLHQLCQLRAIFFDVLSRNHSKTTRYGNRKKIGRNM